MTGHYIQTDETNFNLVHTTGKTIVTAVYVRIDENPQSSSHRFNCIDHGIIDSVAIKLALIAGTFSANLKGRNTCNFRYSIFCVTLCTLQH